MTRNHTLGRNESHIGEVADARDDCKLHIVEHYIVALLGLSKYHSTFEVLAVDNAGNDPAAAMLIHKITGIGIDMHYVTGERESRTIFGAVFLYHNKTDGNITTANSTCSKLSTEQLSECRHLPARIDGRNFAICLPEVQLDTIYPKAV